MNTANLIISIQEVALHHVFHLLNFSRWLDANIVRCAPHLRIKKKQKSSLGLHNKNVPESLFIKQLFINFTPQSSTLNNFSVWIKLSKSYILMSKEASCQQITLKRFRGQKSVWQWVCVCVCVRVCVCACVRAGETEKWQAKDGKMFTFGQSQ